MKPSPLIPAVLSLALACQLTAPADRAPLAARDAEAPFPVVGWFDDYSEILRGVARTDDLRTRGVLVLEGELTGMRCVGQVEMLTMPIQSDPFTECAGRTGRFNFECTDGRIAQGNYRSLGCGKGVAKGSDQFGHAMLFVYGYEESEIEGIAKRELALAPTKPPLPHYDPALLRKTKGFNTGSGFFVSREGHLITSFHVVKGARALDIMMPDGSELRALYLRGDLENDLALLRVEAETEPLALGTDATLRKGDEVFTLGFPLVSLQGQAVKATFGHVNALSGLNDDLRFAQVDVPIQPGNSGGPLLDLEGRVVGVVASMLNQIEALRLSGALPQNVNYVVKAGPVRALLREELGAVPDVAEPPGSASKVELVALSERSVALIIAR